MAAGVAVNLTPGADVAFATACGSANGWRAGVAAAAGISVGCLFHIALTAAGLATLVQAFPAALEIIRWAGAAYLAWLAWITWNASNAQRARAAPGLRTTFLRGMITNVLNPKVALFILAFLPQFTDPTNGSVAAQIIILGLIFTATGLLINAGYGASAGALAAPMRRHSKIINRLSAGIMAALAMRLIFIR